MQKFPLHMIVFFFDFIKEDIQPQFLFLCWFIQFKEQRNQCNRRNQGSYHRKYNGQTQLHENLSCHTAREAKRQINNNGCNRRCHDGCYYLRRTLQRCF